MNISNGEGGNSARTKINGLFPVATVAELVASTEGPRGEGEIWRAAGYRFEEAASDASDHHLTTAGGVKLRALPVMGADGGVYVPEQFGGGTDKSASVNTTAIQAALDSIPLGSTLLIPAGIYPVTSQSTYVFTLTRNVNIKGDGARSTLRGDSVSNTTSMFGIAFAENAGNTDVRNWFMDGVRMFYNGGGQHAVDIYGGFPLNTCRITNNTLGGNVANGGYSLYVSDDENLQHSLISDNTCPAPMYLKCGDANVFTRNNIYASSGGPAMTFDMLEGVRCNIVDDNTLVSRDGAVHVINGDELRICNNQIEQFLVYGENQSTPSCSVYLEGADRIVTGCIIENNNFGGGTNVDYGIYADNAQHCVITRNDFVAHDIDEVYFTANSKFNIWEFDNEVRTQVSNPRTDDYFKANITDISKANIQTPVALTGENSWSDNTVFKRKDGCLVFMDQISGGTVTAGTVIYTLPAPMIGYSTVENLISCDASGDLVTFKITSASGELALLTAAPSSAGISIPPVYRTPISSTDY